MVRQKRNSILMTAACLVGGLLFSTICTATQVLSSHNLSIALFHCHGDASLDLSHEMPKLLVHSSKCRYVGAEDGELKQNRSEGYILRRNEVRLISVQSPNGSVMDSFLVDTRQQIP